MRLVQTQTNIYEVVIEMNIRQLNVERRTDQIEEELRRMQVRIQHTCIALLTCRPLNEMLINDGDKTDAILTASLARSRMYSK